MTFGISPASGFPPPAADDFPNYIQFQSAGADLGGPDADTVNFVGLTATRGVGENANVVTVSGDGAAGFEWVDVPGDYDISIADVNIGLSCSANTGFQTLTVPGDTGDADIDVPNGTAILIYQEGDATAEVVPVSGVLLRYRDAFDPSTAGQFATLTLIKRRANEWVLCGDLAAAA